ncbi:MAG: GFA family protein [Gemmatimonadota bacterium]
MTQPVEGGCYCGAIRYRAAGPPKYQVICYCANCRRAAGAQSVAWVTVALGDFAFVAGAPVRYRTDTGAWRTFCGTCGTSLTYQNDRRPDEIDITTGSLDAAADHAPTLHAYAEERLGWEPLLGSGSAT